MSEQTVIYRDTDLNFDEAYYYVLLLMVDGETFSYAVTYKNKLMAYEQNCPVTEIVNPAQMQELLGARFKKIIVAVPSTAGSLIPVDLFNEDRLPELAHLLDVKNTEKVLIQLVDEQNYMICKVEEQLLTTLSRFDLKSITFTAKGFIKAVAKNNPLNNQLYINLGAEKADFLNFKDYKINFYNNFFYKKPDDLVYYTLLVSKELDILPQDVTIIISGDVTVGDTFLSALSAFFTNVTINNMTPLELPEGVNPHQILSLAALSLCELSEAF